MRIKMSVNGLRLHPEQIAGRCWLLRKEKKSGKKRDGKITERRVAGGRGR